MSDTYIRGDAHNPQLYAPFPTVDLSSTAADRQSRLALQAQRADFMLSFYDPYHPTYDGGPDATVFAGDGVDNLDDFLTIMADNPQGQFSLNIGDSTDSWLPVTAADIQYVKTVYISFYGTTNKPNVYNDAVGIAERLG